MVSIAFFFFKSHIDNTDSYWHVNTVLTTILSHSSLSDQYVPLVSQYWPVCSLSLNTDPYALSVSLLTRMFSQSQYGPVCSYSTDPYARSVSVLTRMLSQSQYWPVCSLSLRGLTCMLSQFHSSDPYVLIISQYLSMCSINFTVLIHVIPISLTHEEEILATDWTLLLLEPM